jgi:hypothetical protein
MWIKQESPVITFQNEGEPEVIHIIPTGFANESCPPEDMYVVVTTSAYGQDVQWYKGKEEIEKLYGITIN